MTTFKSRGFCEVGETFSQKGRRSRRPSKPAKSTVLQISEASVNSISTKSTKSRIHPNQIHLSYVVTWQIGVTRT